MMTDPKFVDVEGIKTRYFDKGSGEILLLVHGSHMGTPDACESALDWEFNFDGTGRALSRYRHGQARAGLHRQPQNRCRLHHGGDGQTCSRFAPGARA